MTIFGIIFFILLLIGIGVLIYKIDDGEISFFGTTIITIVIFVIILWLGSIDSKQEKDNYSGVTYISSMSANSSVGGHFFLGSGTIEKKDYYYYMVNSKFGYRVRKLEITDNTYIKEDCSSTPFIEFTKYKTTYINWFGRLFFKKHFYNNDGEIIFHVPKNTVVKDYMVDVSNL